MCYAKPGPRCSSHAGQVLARIRTASYAAASRQYDSDEEREETFDKLIDLKARAQEEYNITPAGITRLQAIAKMYSGTPKHREYQQKVRKIKRERIRRLSLIKEKSTDTDIFHASPQEKIYQKLGLQTSLDPTTSPRKGWFDGSPQFAVSTALLSKASDAWMRKLDPKQIAALNWFTHQGSAVVSLHEYITSEDGKEFTLQRGSLSIEEIVERRKTLQQAFDHAPRLTSPIVLYRGVGNALHFDLDTVVKEGKYTPPVPLSATINPAIANRFGYSGKIALEIKTSRFASPTNFSEMGTSEEEVMIAPGAKFKVVNVLHDVAFGNFSGFDSGYTVVQMEEVN